MEIGRFFHIALRIIAKLLRLAVIMVLVAGFCAPLTASRMPSILEQIQAQGKLVVMSRNGPTTYYEGPEGVTGFEYQLTKGFAKSLGVELEIVELEDLGRMIDGVGQRAHLAAAGLTVTERRQQKVAFTNAYMEVTQQLVYNADQAKPKDINDLIGKKILVIGSSSHAERLRELRREYHDLEWEERNDIEMLDLLEMVHNKKVDFAVVDSNAYDLNNSLYPKAKIAFALSEAQPIAWAFPQTQDKSLLEAANSYIEEAKVKGKLADLSERFYGHVGEIGYSGALVFSRRIESRLPKWQDLLQQAANETELDWLLLAALSYQESHWNPKAKSPTGVRGFMMLTLSTAKEMSVKNRLNAKQSIFGGAQYFKKLLNRMPESIEGQDRIWMTLAAYNVGFGHLEDARILAQHYGSNPNKWADVKEFLPLLAKRQYYKFTKHGYARGHEAVTYVQNIRNFYTVLAWNEQEQQRLTELAMVDPDSDVSEFGALISELVANQSYAANSL